VVCREQPVRGQNHLQRVQGAELGQHPHGGELPSVQQMVSNHLSHDRLPPVKRVLRDHHRHTAAVNSVLHKVVAIVDRWLEVTGCTQKLPKTARKSVPVQASGVYVPLLVNNQQLLHLSQQKTDGSADGNKNYQLWTVKEIVKMID